MRRSDREIVEHSEIGAIIDACKVCRIGMRDGDRIYVLPLNFGYSFGDGGELVLYFHCATEGKKLDLMRACPQVGVEMDCDHELVSGGDVPCRYGFRYASLVGFGIAELLEDPADKVEALRLLMKHQTGMDFTLDSSMTNGVAVFRITVSSFSCKRR